jgi:hypothetical protein
LEQELKAQSLTLKRLKDRFQLDIPESFPELTIEQHDFASYLGWARLIWLLG